MPITQGSIFGEVGLISGRKRGSTIRAAEEVLAVELSRNAALKLLATSTGANRAVEKISIERQLLQMFGAGLKSADISELVDKAEVVSAKAGQKIVEEGADDKDIFIVRSGSMIVEKEIGGRPVFLSYMPAGSYFGEMAVIDGSKRTATVKAAIKSELIKLPGSELSSSNANQKFKKQPLMKWQVVVN